MTKLLETTSDVLLTVNKKNVAHPPQAPPCNVVPQLLPVESNKTSVCDKHDGYNLYDCCDPHLTLLCSSPLWKYLFKGRWSLAENYFKQNFCHACHTRFAILLCSTILLHIQKFPIVWYYIECTSKYAVRIWVTKNQETQSVSTWYSFAHWERLFRNNKHVSCSFNVQGKTRSLMLDNMDHYTFLGNCLTTYPSPKSTFCPQWEVSDNVGLGEG